MTKMATSFQFLGPKTAMTSNQIGCTDRSQDRSDQGPKWPDVGCIQN